MEYWCSVMLLFRSNTRKNHSKWKKKNHKTRILKFIYTLSRIKMFWNNLLSLMVLNTINFFKTNLYGIRSVHISQFYSSCKATFFSLKIKINIFRDYWYYFIVATYILFSQYLNQYTHIYFRFARKMKEKRFLNL